jgi:hypothetical protein
VLNRLGTSKRLTSPLTTMVEAGNGKVNMGYRSKGFDEIDLLDQSARQRQFCPQLDPSQTVGRIDCLAQTQVRRSLHSERDVSRTGVDHRGSEGRTGQGKPQNGRLWKGHAKGRASNGRM